MLQNISIPSDKIFGFEIAEKVEIKYKSNEELSASLLFLILQFTFTATSNKNNSHQIFTGLK